ncbi:MAG: hypothetical protein GY830_00525, partial [Bacteroidetes bacterium]|nr:hypothetical protein [Bacteroidota bacterium]
LAKKKKIKAKITYKKDSFKVTKNVDLKGKLKKGKGGVVAAEENLVVGSDVVGGSKKVIKGSNGSSKIRYKKPKKSKTKLSAKERASNAPDWAKQYKPRIDEDGKAFAKRLMNEKYGAGNYKKGSKTEFSEIQKWADRHFE